jgi:hypothetical protein
VIDVGVDSAAHGIPHWPHPRRGNHLCGFQIVNGAPWWKGKVFYASKIPKKEGEINTQKSIHKPGKPVLCRPHGRSQAKPGPGKPRGSGGDGAHPALANGAD